MKKLFITLTFFLSQTAAQALVWCNPSSLDNKIYIQSDQTIEVVTFSDNDSNFKAALDACVMQISNSRCKADYNSEIPAGTQLDNCKIQEAFEVTKNIMMNGPPKSAKNSNPSVLDFTE